jgi:hypothetical protein
LQRYEWERPGDLIHIDVKPKASPKEQTLARFRYVGHRITDNSQKGRSYGLSYDKVHVAVETPHPWWTLRFWRTRGSSP